MKATIHQITCCCTIRTSEIGLRQYLQFVFFFIFQVSPTSYSMPSAVILGASRGIGRQIALTFAANGYKVCVAAKTDQPDARLPGTINTVAEEISQDGGIALPIKCNARDPLEIENCVKTCINEFGTLDCVIYNAGAILWDKIMNTPLKRLDLFLDVNLRGAYAFSQSVIPHFLNNKNGKMIFVSPPVYSRFLRGKTPYAISKFGQTFLMMGLAHELKDTNLSFTSVWPSTNIQAFVTEKLNVPPDVMRKPSVFADACHFLAQEPTNKWSGKAVLDEDILREYGVTDFTKYRCKEDTEPPRMMPKRFPDLRVEEEEESFPLPKSKL